MPSIPYNPHACAPGVPAYKIMQPGNSNKKIEYTCFDRPTLIELINAYNKHYDGKRKTITYSKSDTLDDLWKKLRSSVNECKNESDRCIIDQSFINEIQDQELFDIILNQTFKPKRPVGETTWLSNFDIADVLKQYERIIPEFAYYGPYPSDIHKLYTGEVTQSTPGHRPLKGFLPLDFTNVEELTKGFTKKYIGFTFNTDASDKGGAHWVSLSLELDYAKKIVYFNYFDSVGNYPNVGIQQFIEHLVNLFTDSDKFDKIVVRYNRVQHQTGNSECGVYSINFQLQILSGESFDSIVSNIFDDELTQSTRSIIFS